MNVNNPLLPPQAKRLLTGPQKVETYESTGGAVTAQFAAHNLTFISPITSGSIIHDNACGLGTASKAILSSHPNPSTLKIYATDIDQTFLDALQQDAKKNSWPVEISNQRCESLSFPDNTFTHSITNIGIFFTASNGLEGAKEIYRTLQPGGVAVANCWENVTWFLPIKTVHDNIRPGAPYPTPVINWSDGQQLQKVMLEAGFSKENLKVERSEAWARVKDLRGWAEKTWAFLAGIGGWRESDAEKWDEAVELLEEELKKAGGTKVVDGEVCMRASQWVVVATK